MKSYSFVIMIAAFISLGSCCSDKPTDNYSEFIEEYHLSTVSVNITETSEAPAIYIDRSNGIIHAYNNKENKEMLMALVQKVNQKSEFYELLNDEIVKYQDDPFVIYNEVTDPNFYDGIYAPILKTLESITDDKRDALLITDYEEYTTDRTEQFEAYADVSFIKWIKDGNRIDFFYLDSYEEINNSKTTQKRLYFTVFSYGNKYELLHSVEDAFKERSFKPEQYTLDLSSFSISNKYDAKDTPGVESKIITMDNGMINNYFRNEELDYEFFGLAPNKEKLSEYFTKMLTSDDGKFLNNLFLDASNNNMYEIQTLELKVEDISKDYEQLYRSKVANDLIKDIKFTKNDLNETIWDSTKINQFSVIKEIFISNTDIPKPAYTFATTSDSRTNLLNEAFSLNEKVYEAHLNNSPESVEIRTVIHSNYRLDNLGDDDGLYRVQIILKEVEENLDLEDFAWNSIIKGGGKNNCLLESIRNVIQDPKINPKNKVLYTYYFKFANTPVFKVIDATQGRFKPNN